MTSVRVKIDNSVTRQSGPYCFKIQGELHHLTGALLPHSDQTIYAQIYILDTAEQLNVRRLNDRNLDLVVMDNLQTMLLDSYPYIGHYCHAYELIREKLVEEISIRLHVNLQQDQRTYNLLTAEEIAVIIPEEGVHHVLLFPKRENGWHPRIPICGAQLREQGKNTRQRDREEWACSQVVSDRCYYVYCLHVRDGSQPPLFYGRKLL